MITLHLSTWNTRRLQSAVNHYNVQAAFYEAHGAPIAAQIARDWASQYAAEITRRIAAAAPAPAEEG